MLYRMQFESLLYLANTTKKFIYLVNRTTNFIFLVEESVLTKFNHIVFIKNI